jgi:glutathione synthase/RimK-type ligase-like ATP-grasp enzyme
MLSTVILRRRNLGNTSCRELSRLSREGMVVVRNNRDPFPPNTNLVIRWGCTSNVPTRNVVNTARAIHLVNDKNVFRMTLDQHGLCPRTWNRLDDIDFTTPVIVRPMRHHQGRNTFLCHNRDHVVDAIYRCGEGWYASEYINKTNEYRVFVVQGRAAGVVEKIPEDPDAIVWNHHAGSSFENIRWGNWDLNVVKICIDAFNLSGLDFGGVDVIKTNGRVYVLEINSAPSLTSSYRQEVMAKCFDWIIRNGKNPIPIHQSVEDGYRKFIHPGACPEAIVEV